MFEPKDRYYYRIFNVTGKMTGVDYVSDWPKSKPSEALAKNGRVTTNHGIVKPRNILYVAGPHDQLTITNFILSLPMQLDLSTINLTDYPELFI